MTQSDSASLSDFMKKKFRENSKNNHSNVKKKDEEDIDNEKEEEKKKIRIAKNESNQKAANYNKFEMYKKMVVECLIGYLAMLTAVVILILFCILIGPALMGFFQTIISKLVLASLCA